MAIIEEKGFAKSLTQWLRRAGFIQNFVCKISASVKYRKSDWFIYGMYPQTVKEKDVVIKDANQEKDVYYANATYYIKEYVTQKKFRSQDGQVFKKGDAVFFRLESIIWEKAGNEVIKDASRNNNIARTTDVYCVSRMILDAADRPMNDLSSDTIGPPIEETKPHRNHTRFEFLQWYNVRGVYVDHFSLVGKRLRKRKITDYARFHGVSYTGKYGYYCVGDKNDEYIDATGRHTFGHSVDSKIVPGSVLSFTYSENAIEHKMLIKK